MKPFWQALCLVLGWGLLCPSSVSNPLEGEPRRLSLAFGAAFESQFSKTGHYNWLRDALLFEGYDFDVVWMPNKRGMVEANAGRIDGDLTKVATVAAGFTNLVQVDEPFFYACVVAYGVAANASQSIRHLGVIRGLEYLNKSIPKLNQEYQFYPVERLQQGLDMVAYGRLDALLLPTVVSKLLPPSKMKGLEIISPTLLEYPTYIYLHRRHRELAERLQRRLSETRPKEIQNHCDTGVSSEAAAVRISLQNKLRQ